MAVFRGERRGLFAGVPVFELEAAVAFYEGLFGRPADVAVTDNSVM
ncbi:MAG: hypothetical protein ABSG36_01565 [Acidimicrobiales bacterium]